MWGRFSLRNSLSKNIILDNGVEMYNYSDDKKYDVRMIDHLNDNTIMLDYKVKEEFLLEHSSSNVVVSLWTTSAARVLLYNAMKKVYKTPDCTILYTDTDSIIYKHRLENDPLPTGKHLGELTDECPKHQIKEFVLGKILKKKLIYKVDVNNMA